MEKVLIPYLFHKIRAFQPGFAVGYPLQLSVPSAIGGQEFLCLVIIGESHLCLKVFSVMVAFASVGMLYFKKCMQ